MFFTYSEEEEEVEVEEIRRSSRRRRNKSVSCEIRDSGFLLERFSDGFTDG
jgi:hypothetical protein